MTNVSVILQIMFITIGTVGLSLFLNKILGLNLENAREMREKALNIQERMRTAQATANPMEMAKLQQESTALMKDMMKKQFVPSCIRCIVFIGIFALIGFIYADYSAGLLPFVIPLLGDGWFALYFLFSLGFSLLAYGIKRLYRKLTGKIDKRSKISKEIMQVLSPSPRQSGSSLELTRPLPNRSSSLSEKNNAKSEKMDSWKDRIEN